MLYRWLSLHSTLVAHQVGVYLQFPWYETMSVSAPPGWVTNPSQDKLQPKIVQYPCVYTWCERGTLREKYLAQEHNAMNLPRTQTWTTCFGIGHTNDNWKFFQSLDRKPGHVATTVFLVWYAHFCKQVLLWEQTFVPLTGCIKFNWFGFVPHEAVIKRPQISNVSHRVYCSCKLSPLKLTNEKISASCVPACLLSPQHAAYAYTRRGCMVPPPLHVGSLNMSPRLCRP